MVINHFVKVALIIEIKQRLRKLRFYNILIYFLTFRVYVILSNIEVAKEARYSVTQQ